MSSTLTRAIRYDLIDELDELYECIAEAVVGTENLEHEQGAYPEGSYPDEIIRLFNAVEGAVAVCDAKGGHEHGEPGELESKGGLRNA